MNHAKHLTLWACGSLISALAMLLVVGCQSTQEQPSSKPATATATATTPAAPAMTAESTSALPAIRIDAGSTRSYTDSAGNVWLADQGFADGDVADRGDDTQIASTKDPAIYRTEHYGMTSFSQKVPNGKYIVKLHFAETYGDITGAGQRVFSFTVGGHEFKDFDVYAKAGGAQRADVETVDVDVTDGKLDIAFTANIQSPEINGIEIIPAP
jgi:hypothetical protein